MSPHLSLLLFGKPVDRHLPERVRERIHAQQRNSEMLISWVQFALIILFGTLWLVAPKTIIDADLNPVPWALGFYFVFTILRLALSYLDKLGSPFLVLSVIFDMALLMVLIWSFHIQYDQPASFYLKAPTLMYVFIFIALRALRFEPGYILLAGGTAALGWLSLMGYVLSTETDAGAVITRDYVKYMTSNAILIGAEIDKIVSIILVTLVIALAVTRARRTLYRSILDSTAAQDLSRFVSREVANHITSSEKEIQPGDGESVNATVMFTDIEGFSTVAETMTPKELAATLNDYFEAMSNVIDKHGGVVTHFEGDAMLVTYNAVTALEEHGRAAIDTAIEIQKAASQPCGPKNFVLPTRCGINTGEIIVGAIGAQDRLAFTVHGDNVNIAARLEQLNKEHGTYIMCTAATVEAVGDGHQFQAVSECPVKGRRAAVNVFTVDASQGHLARNAASPMLEGPQA